MDTVTYPDPQVQRRLSDAFVGFELDMFARHPDFKVASGASKVIWAPTMIFEDQKGRELRRYVGWLKPSAFIAELDFVAATASFQNVQFQQANERFQRILETHADEDIVAETLYWHGIAAFLASNKDSAALAASWERLVREHPKTRWAMHASVIEDAT